MALLHYLWSRVAASNSNADANINWAEGQSPSSVNDSARAMMASAAGFRDDISGAITTGGTSTAYTVSSFQVFDTLAHMDKMVIAFTPHATNGDTVTLNVDGLGAKPLRSSPGVELLAGTLILGTPYLCTYNNSSAVWYLQSFFGNPYNVPLGSGMDYWLPTAPNSSFVFPIGQAVSRTTYAALFVAMGTTYGVGDGSTTFNLPDKTGRISAMKEAVATRLTSTYFGGNSTNLGAVGGLESQTLSLAQLPTGISSTNSGSIAVSTSSTNNVVQQATGTASSGASGGGERTLSIGNGAVVAQLSSTGTAAPGAAVVTSTNTSGSAHPNVQPTIVCNYIMRII